MPAMAVVAVERDGPSSLKAPLAEGVSMSTRTPPESSCSASTVREPELRKSQIVTEIVRTSVPNIAGYSLTLVNEFTNTVILGRTGDQASQAAMGLSNLMLNCLAITVANGMACALDTFVSQAHGAGQHDVACHHFQRCRVLVSLQLLWMLPVLWCSGDILALLGQDPEVSAQSSEYIRASLVGLFPFFQYEAIRKYLQNLEDPIPPATICAMGSLLHVGWAWFFAIDLGWGSSGAGYANAVTWWTQFALATAYLACTAERRGLRRRAVIWVEAPGLCNWADYMRLAVPATVQLCSEAWFWEICVLVVGYLGKVALAAHVTTLNWVTISTTASLGVNASTATLVGSALGANLPRKAKVTAWLCVAVNLCVWSCFAFGMVYARRPLSEFYSTDVEVQALMQKLLPIFAAVGFCDSMHMAMSGALRGIGRHSLAAATYLLAYYGVMLPGSILAAFTLEMGIFGIWGSFGLGTGLATAVFVVALCRIDYSQAAAETSARLELESLAASEYGGSPGCSRSASCSLREKQQAAAAPEPAAAGSETPPEVELRTIEQLP